VTNTISGTGDGRNAQDTVIDARERFVCIGHIRMFPASFPPHRRKRRIMAAYQRGIINAGQAQMLIAAFGLKHA
jgi:hypothetical protein